MHHLARVDLAFSIIEEERVRILETKLGEFVAGIGKGFGEVGDWGEKLVEAIQVVFAEFVGGLVGDELVSSEGLVVEDSVGNTVAQFLKALVAAVDECLNFLIGEYVEVVENFGD